MQVLGLLTTSLTTPCTSLGMWTQLVSPDILHLQQLIGDLDTLVSDYNRLPLPPRSALDLQLVIDNILHSGRTGTKTRAICNRAVKAMQCRSNAWIQRSIQELL